MASVTKRGNSWLIRINAGVDQNGKRIVRSETYYPKAKSENAQRKEAEAYALDLENQAKRRGLYNNERLTLNEYYKQWFRDTAPITLTTSKMEYYESVMKRVFLPKLGQIEIDQIRPGTIKPIVTDMNNRGMSPATVKTYLSVLSSIMGSAENDEVISSNPVKKVRRPKCEKDDTIHTFTIEEAKTFLSALEGEYPMEHKTHTRTLRSTGQTYTVQTYEQTSKISSMWKAYFWLALFTGCRRGELVALTWADIDTTRNLITITKSAVRTKAYKQITKDPKSRAGFRQIYVPGAVMEKLAIWKEEQRVYARMLGDEWKGQARADFDNGFVFTQASGKQLDVSSPTAKFKDILAMYNNSVPEAEQLPDIHLHDLRHCTASILINSGMDIVSVSRMLGHADIAVTLQRYTHALTKSNAAIADKLESLLTDNKEERMVYAA